jgi:hypothetical protein
MRILDAMQILLAVKWVYGDETTVGVKTNVAAIANALQKLCPLRCKVFVSDSYFQWYVKEEPVIPPGTKVFGLMMSATQSCPMEVIRGTGKRHAHDNSRMYEVKDDGQKTIEVAAGLFG